MELMTEHDPPATMAILSNIRSHMAESGEWNRKGAALSDVTAQKEYGVTRDFIVKGIQAGKLEFREGAVWGNPYLRVLRNQLELYIAAQLGSEYLLSRKSQTELRAVNKEIAHLRKKLAALEAQKIELERAVKI
jgi:hypothetical protein